MGERRRFGGLTPAQSKALLGMERGGGEAIKRAWRYEAGGETVAMDTVMNALARKGLVMFETVGTSTFALLTTRGRALLPAPQGTGPEDSDA